MSNPYDDLVPGDGDSVNPQPKPNEPQPQENNMNGKPILQSKTFWANAITAIAGVVAALSGSDLIQANPQWAAIAATVMGVVNIALRFVTNQPVTVK
jgi:hypothetical protein